jgi:hypothetical protein
MPIPASFLLQWPENPIGRWNPGTSSNLWPAGLLAHNDFLFPTFTTYFSQIRRPICLCPNAFVVLLAVYGATGKRTGNVRTVAVLVAFGTSAGFAFRQIGAAHAG